MSALPPHLRRGWGMSARSASGWATVMVFQIAAGRAWNSMPTAVRPSTPVPSRSARDLLNTMLQIAGEELGLPLEKMRMVAADTELTDESGSSSATRQTYFTGNAVRIAASELREQILDIAGRHLMVHPHEVTLQQGWAFRNGPPGKPRESGPALWEQGLVRGYSLKATGLFKPRTVGEQRETGQSPQGLLSPTCLAPMSRRCWWIWRLGRSRSNGTLRAHDVGKAINPQSVEGQIIGGVAQGVGMALMEEVVYNNGRIMNPGFTDYIIPTIKDLPPVEAVIVEHDDPGGPFGAHGIGEPPLIGAVPAILSAIFNATGVAPHTLPVNPERMWRLLQERHRHEAFTQ